MFTYLDVHTRHKKLGIIYDYMKFKNYILTNMCVKNVNF